VNCNSGLPGTDGDLFKKDDELGKPGTYGEITLLGSSSFGIFIYVNSVLGRMSIAGIIFI
jgi:hypothetical protein